MRLSAQMSAVVDRFRREVLVRSKSERSESVAIWVARLLRGSISALRAEAQNQGVSRCPKPA